MIRKAKMEETPAVTITAVKDFLAAHR